MTYAVDFIRKLGKGIYLLRTHNLFTNDYAERIFLFTKSRHVKKKRFCVVTDAEIKSGDFFYMKYPYKPEISVSVFGMYLLKNNFKPENEDFTAKYVAENLHKLHDKFDDLEFF